MPTEKPESDQIPQIVRDIAQDHADKTGATGSITVTDSLKVEAVVTIKPDVSPASKNISQQKPQ